MTIDWNTYHIFIPKPGCTDNHSEFVKIEAEDMSADQLTKALLLRASATDGSIPTVGAVRFFTPTMGTTLNFNNLRMQVGSGITLLCLCDDTHDNVHLSVG